MAVAPDDVSALFPGPDAWDGVPYDPPINSNCLRMSTSAPNSTQGYRGLFSDTLLPTGAIPEPSEPITMQAPIDTVHVSFSHLTRLNGSSRQPVVTDHIPHPVSTSQANWIPMNASRSSSSDLNNAISPLQTCFDSQSLSNASISADGCGRSPTASPFDHWNADAEEDAHLQKRRCSSDTTYKGGMSPPTTKRTRGGRRASENVEPGSARAIYLEKNRKAASKCRNKQKVQQEELIESARECERKNRLLKAEVDLLKADMRDLMAVVSRHTECPDKRLQTYVQKEADRLAAKDTNDVVAQLLATEHDFSPGRA